MLVPVNLSTVLHEVVKMCKFNCGCLSHGLIYPLVCQCFSQDEIFKMQLAIVPFLLEMLSFFLRGYPKSLMQTIQKDKLPFDKFHKEQDLAFKSF